MSFFFDDLDQEPVVEEKEEKIKKPSPFDYTKAIGQTGEDIFEESSYNPFMVNRALSFGADTAIFANEMNKYRDIPKRAQFIFLQSTIRKRKRFDKWLKPTKLDKIETIKKFYKYSTRKAMSVADLISDADVAVMEQKMFTGGVNEPASQSSGKA